MYESYNDVNRNFRHQFYFDKKISLKFKGVRWGSTAEKEVRLIMQNLKCWNPFFQTRQIVVELSQK